MPTDKVAHLEYMAGRYAALAMLLQWHRCQVLDGVIGIYALEIMIFLGASSLNLICVIFSFWFFM